MDGEMEQEVPVLNNEEGEAEFDERPIELPVHTKQAAKALALLLFYSFLMFTLPFLAFFGTRHVLQEVFQVTGFNNTAVSVFAAVVVVNLVIVAYAYQAFREKEYDDEGNEIVEGEEAKKED